MLNRTMVAVFGVLGLLVTGSLIAPPATRAQAVSNVRAVNMSPGFGPAEVLLDGVPVTSGLEFRGATDYAAIPAGRHTVTLRHTGAQAAEVEAIVDFEPGRYRTLICTLTDGQIVPLSLNDETVPPPPGQAKVRFVHTAPDVPAVDVAVQGGPVLFRDIDFRGISAYADVPAGSYTLAVNRAGTPDTLLMVPGVSVTPGQVLTVFGAGRISDGNVQAVPLTYPAEVTGAAPPSTLPSSGVGFLADSGPSSGLVALFATTAAALLVLVGLRRRLAPSPAGDGSTWDSWGPRRPYASVQAPPSGYQMPSLAPSWRTDRARAGVGGHIRGLSGSLVLVLLGLLTAIAGLVLTRLKRPNHHRRGC